MPALRAARLSRLILQIAAALCLLLAACSPPATPSAGLPTPTPAITDSADQPFVVVDIRAEDGRLPAQLRAGFQKAVESGLNAYAFFTAEWCENCQEIEQSLKDASMAHVFRGAYIMRLDLDVWADQARESGLYVVGVPAFYGIGADGRANGRAFIGGASGQDSAGRSITSLEDFFNPSP